MKFSIVSQPAAYLGESVRPSSLGDNSPDANELMIGVSLMRELPQIRVACNVFRSYFCAIVNDASTKASLMTCHISFESARILSQSIGHLGSYATG